MLSVITLTPTNAQTISHNDTLDVALSATDADGDSVAYTATVGVDSKVQLVYNLDRQYNFRTLANADQNDYYTSRGHILRFL